MSLPRINITEKVSEIKRMMQTGDQSARKEATGLLNAMEDDRGDAEWAEIYHLMAAVEFYDNKAKEAISWYGKELKLRINLKDTFGASIVLNNLGAIYYNKGKLDKAKECYQKALIYKKSLNDQPGIAAIYNNLGAVLLDSGKAAEAYRMHSSALEINRTLGDTQRIGASLQNIGLTYLSQGDYDLALSHLMEALTIADASGDKTRAVQHMINIGTALVKKGNIGDAKKYYEKCHRESQSINYHYGLILSLTSLASVANQQGKHQESIRYNLDCIQIARTTDHLAEITTALAGIGISYISLKDYEQALRYLLDALDMVRKTGIKERLSEICLSLHEVYEKQGDHKKALSFYKKHIALRDEMVNKETTRTISEIKAHYELEQKEKEARLLKEKADAISMYVQKLEVSNNELRQFAHVASHDLREPLRMVSSYMVLLEQNLGDQATDLQRQFITFAADGATRMEALIHDLLRLAKVDSDTSIEPVSLTDILNQVKINLERLIIDKKAVISVRGHLPTIRADKTQMLQIFQNLIANGIKYNESSEPVITLHCENSDQEIALYIADNGIGIEEQYREKAFQLFQRVPTARAYSGTGIGLAICKKIVDGMNGKIIILDNAGGGSIFKITLPDSVARTDGADA